MKNAYLLILVSLFLSGCAAKMAYLNTQKPADEVQEDKSACQAMVDALDFKDSGLKQNKFNACMKDRGYNVVSEAEAEKIQGFKELWVKPDADFKLYEVAFFEEVDVGGLTVKNTGIGEVGEEQIKQLGAEMLKRFSLALNSVIPVIPDKEAAQGRQVLYISLKLDNVSETNVGLSAALQVAGELSPVPLPGGPEGDFSFQGTVADYSSRENLITMSDAVKGDKNSSLVGSEKFSHWQKTYNVMDYWADKFAGLIAKERGQEYKSRMHWKVI